MNITLGRSLRRSATTATALAPAATALMASPAAMVTAQEQSTPLAVTSGTFGWGLRPFLLGFLASPATGGLVTATAGASCDDLVFSYPADAAQASVQADGCAVLPLVGGADQKACEGKGPQCGNLAREGDGLVLIQPAPSLELSSSSATSIAVIAAALAGIGGLGVIVARALSLLPTFQR